ncbi:hypothetical protein [Streptomyces peucetius]|uniref:Uncharacterized protein n=1 Tax=Streptomyces peucetius TaxID=1950 RepID=A0ABY6IM22_STRPE|nr:hypothetical protein [Streptomyces peucetius]UYQ66812.1 hypothetical protein OGH68_17860 [Streptomyces peucetius]
MVRIIRKGTRLTRTRPDETASRRPLPVCCLPYAAITEQTRRPTRKRAARVGAVLALANHRLHRHARSVSADLRDKA